MTGRITRRGLGRGFAAAPAALLLAGCGTGSDDGPPVSGISTSDNDGYAGIWLPKPYQLKDVRLTDDDELPFSTSAGTRGKLSIVFFGYIQCPDICQQVMGSIASAFARLDSAAQKKVQMLYVTTDPARDKAPELKAYLSRLNPDFVGLTGPLARIDEFGKPMGVFIRKGKQLPSGGYEVDHSTQVLAVNGRDQVPLVWNATTSPSDLAKDINKLLANGEASGKASS